MSSSSMAPALSGERADLILLPEDREIDGVDDALGLQPFPVVGRGLPHVGIEVASRHHRVVECSRMKVGDARQHRGDLGPMMDHAIEPCGIEVPMLLETARAGREVTDADHSGERTGRLANLADCVGPLPGIERTIINSADHAGKLSVRQTPIWHWIAPRNSGLKCTTSRCSAVHFSKSFSSGISATRGRCRRKIAAILNARFAAPLWCGLDAGRENSRANPEISA
jgi:hypothetical protein